MHKYHLSLSTYSLRSVLIALCLAAVATPAQAGFQWVSPPQTQDQVAPSAPSVAPGPVTAPAVSLSPVDSLPPAQIIEGKRPVPQSSASSVPAPIVQGFADKVPLSVALRQILPDHIAFSVAQDVNLGSLVSWKGGASWQKVMTDMLTPAGLSFKDQGSMVQIVRAGAGVAAPLPRAADAGATAGLLPPISDLPVRAVPDRNMPEGRGGILGGGVPASDAPMSLVPSSVPSSPSSFEPAATQSSPYILDKSVSAWTANRGETLQSVLAGWCKRANVELSWQAEYDYPLEASVSLSGAFEVAVRSLLAGFQEANPQPVGYLYNNQVAGQTVLVVQARGNTYNE